MAAPLMAAPLDYTQNLASESASELVSTLENGAPSDSAPISVAARRLRHLSEIGLALSAERDIGRLLAMILSTSRQITSSDGGTLYIVEKDRHGDKKLYFRAAQNDSIIVDTKMSFAVAPTSLAGYVALTGEILRFDDVYSLPADAPYKFNPLFDVEHGYKTRSVLVVPLKNHVGEVIGVLQLINRKRRRDTILRDAATVQSEVLGFDDEMVELAATLASQAAVALNNNLLLREIEDLFEALVVASASAIEDRDPTTSGHSERVTTLTVELAKAVSQTREGTYKDVHFSPAQLRELRYAGLLHDFGKIGVREAILTKSHKIEPRCWSDISHRFLALRREWELECSARQIAVWRGEGNAISKETRAAMLARDLAEKLATLEADFAWAQRLNDPNARWDEPSWQSAIEALERLEKLRFSTPEGAVSPLFSRDEIEALRVRNGTLTPREFAQIQEHAQMSYDFLQQIPWTPPLQNVPSIARAHHERLDGSGYPQALRAEEIPLGAKFMAIADVYDALTAADRPYKRALSAGEALENLKEQAKNGLIDAEALRIFIENEVYKTVI